MEFEYDPIKSELNRQKHGISLEEAKALWTVPGTETKARAEEETRFMRIGRLGGKLYSCIYTVRGDTIRLISARRSRIREVKIYEGEKVDEERSKENYGE